MKILEILLKKEYLVYLFLIISFIITFINFNIFLTSTSLIVLFIINIIILITHCLLCVFLEIELNDYRFSTLQLRLQKKLSFLSFLVLLSSNYNIFIELSSFFSFIKYQNNCPFNLSEFDYTLHFKRRCELYNIKPEKLAYQYICSFDAQKDINYQSKYDNFSRDDIKCSRVNFLIDNEVIDSFVYEYYKEVLYYCDLKYQPPKFKKSIDPIYCQIDLNIGNFFLLSSIFLNFYYFFLVIYYFRYINAKVKVKRFFLF